jgi:hypothetical protein
MVNNAPFNSSHVALHVRNRSVYFCLPQECSKGKDEMKQK